MEPTTKTKLADETIDKPKRHEFVWKVCKILPNVRKKEQEPNKPTVFAKVQRYVWKVEQFSLCFLTEPEISWNSSSNCKANTKCGNE